MIIEDWAVVSLDDNPYRAPETLSLSLQGRVFGHPKFDDGKRITTSSIVGKNWQDKVVTRSGSHYELGQADPAYEAKFPGARNRLLDNLSIH